MIRSGFHQKVLVSFALARHIADHTHTYQVDVFAVIQQPR